MATSDYLFSHAPTPEDPPPPPDVSGCVSYNGRWVSANGCN
jgi:hypothetical protein